jgi:hypothetical protein
MRLIIVHVRYAVVAVAGLTATVPASGQIPRESAAELPPAQISTTPANRSVGQVPVLAIGQRQTSDQAAANIVVAGRIEGRINNRVASRLNTRIGSGYRSQADALSAYRAANEETASVSRKTR